MRHSSYHNYDTYFKYFFNLWISVPPTSSTIREQIWIRFVQFTSSEVYTAFWKKLYVAANVKESSVLSFFLTYNYFITLWEKKYPTKQKDRSTETSHLTFDEKNALWYIGGYIIRKVKRKITSMKNEDKDKDDLLVVLDCFVDADHDELEGSTDSDDNDDVADTHIWVNSINRGGLIKCTNNFYSFLRAVELELKCSLTPDTQHLGQPEQTALVISCQPPVVDASRVESFNRK